MNITLSNCDLADDMNFSAVVSFLEKETHTKLDSLQNSFSELQMGVSIFIWIFGVFGNILNILIFSHKNMKCPINSIFVRLAVCDLIELILIAMSAFLAQQYTQLLLYENLYFVSPSFQRFWLLIVIFILLVVHTITVGINISLAFWRYLAVIDPFQKRIQLTSESARLTILVTYVSSFALCSPILSILYYSEDAKYELHIIYLIILRIGLLIILIVISIMLIFAIINVRHLNQHNTINSTHLTERRRLMNRINALVILILVVFVITELPYALNGIVAIQALHLPNNFDTDSHPIFFLCKYLQRCVEITSYSFLFAHLQQLTFLINSSCNTIFYLIFSTAYKKTLKLLLNDKFHWGCTALKHDDDNGIELENI